MRANHLKYAARFLTNVLVNIIRARYVVLPTLLIACASALPAQIIGSGAKCAKTQKGITYPPQKSLYPLASDKYTVEYQLNNDGTWTPAMVYISNYGESYSSPYADFSGYPQGVTSMSFVSIPAKKNTVVMLRVKRVGDTGFSLGDGVTVRPSAKGIDAPMVRSDGRVIVTRNTGKDFAGEQFILYWNGGDPANNGAIQGLVFFLNPPYAAPTTGKIKVITGSINPTDPLTGYDTLDFEGTVVIGDGSSALPVPANITTVFLGPTAWVEGKLLFPPAGGVKVYGPGVLDVSRFEYDLRHCGTTTDNGVYVEQGYPALNSVDSTFTRQPLENFKLDGIIITDNNFYATDSLQDSTVNNVKIIAWNANNDGLQFGDNTTASNVFVRSGDDSLKMWGAADTVTNATVWQNYNGGVVNLGWSFNSPGVNGLIDGLYVVKTDWLTPKHTTWKSIMTKPVNHQNNAVIASMMVPGTEFGDDFPSTYQNIFLDDAPQVLFSLKIVPPRPGGANASKVNLRALSNLDLNIVNVFTPPSVTNNRIGYNFLPKGFTELGQTFQKKFVLQGNMLINLTNLYIVEGTNATLVTADNAGTLGKIVTNGDTTVVQYNPVKAAPPPLLCKQFTCM